MPTDVCCPGCGALLRLPDTGAVRRIRCTSCYIQFRVGHFNDDGENVLDHRRDRPGSSGPLVALLIGLGMASALAVAGVVSLVYLVKSNSPVDNIPSSRPVAIPR